MDWTHKLTGLRGDSLLRTVIEGKMTRKKRSSKPRHMMLDWMMADGYGKNQKKKKIKKTTLETRDA